MNRIISACLLTVISCHCFAQSYDLGKLSTFKIPDWWHHPYVLDIKQDFHYYLSKEILYKAGDALLVAGVIANTGIDRSVHKQWQQSIRNNTLNRFFSLPQRIGGVRWWSFPLYLSSMVIGDLGNLYRFGDPVYNWGYRSLRTALLGGIQQVIFTNLLGSGRPINGADSNWRPFAHRTGVSGHAFYGAIPFLTAAHMTNPDSLRYLLFAASTLPALSRVNSDAHYLSQIIVGWAFAYLSSVAIYQTEMQKTESSEPIWRVSAFPAKGGAFLVAKLKF